MANTQAFIFTLSLVIAVASIGCRSTPAAKSASAGDRFVSTSAADYVTKSAATTIAVGHENSTGTNNYDVAPASASLNQVSSLDSGFVTEAVGPILNSISESIKSELNRLSLEQTVALAIANNPTIPQARSLLQQQNGTTVQAGLYPNPQIGYLRSDPDQPGKSRSSGAFLSQEFVTAGKLKLAQLASRHDVTLRSWQVTAQEQRVINDVRIRFYELAAAQEATRIADELFHSAEDGLRIAQNMKVASIGTRPDVLQAEMQLSNAKGIRNESKLRVEAARQALEAAVGTELTSSELVAELDGSLPDLEWESSLERLMLESPLLKSQAAELQAARIEIQLSDSQAIPNINAQMVAQRDSTEKFNSLGTFVSIPAPIFNRNQGNRISSRAFYAQQVREYERLKLAMADQLSTALRQYKSLQYESQRLKSEILPKASENLELTTAAYKAGRMDFQRVIDARKLLFQTKLAHVESVAELHKTFVEIDGLQLTGALNPTEIGTALQSTASSPNGARSILSQQIQNATGTTNRNLPGALQAGDF